MWRRRDLDSGHQFPGSAIFRVCQALQDTPRHISKTSERAFQRKWPWIQSRVTSPRLKTFENSPSFYPPSSGYLWAKSPRYWDLWITPGSWEQARTWRTSIRFRWHSVYFVARMVISAFSFVVLKVYIMHHRHCDQKKCCVCSFIRKKGNSFVHCLSYISEDLASASWKPEDLPSALPSQACHFEHIFPDPIPFFPLT